MDLRDKKINFLGDSITQGCCTSGGNVIFTEILRKRYYLSEARNYGIGGTRIAPNKTPSEDPAWDEDFCLRVDKMEKDADAVVVFGGTNDYGHGDAPFGNVDDRTSDTFCGSCHMLFQSLKSRFPNVPVLVVTPLHRICDEISKGNDRSGMPRPVLEVYVQAILEIAQAYDFAVLDLFHEGILDAHDPDVMQRYVPDGLHPNDGGHAILAERMATALETL